MRISDRNFCLVCVSSIRHIFFSIISRVPFFVLLCVFLGFGSWTCMVVSDTQDESEIFQPCIVILYELFLNICKGQQVTRNPAPPVITEMPVACLPLALLCHIEYDTQSFMYI